MNLHFHEEHLQNSEQERYGQEKIIVDQKLHEYQDLLLLVKTKIEK